ncbi:hypothetical protein FS837_000697 [Tulasnella sp. UAMH 9824]|nr:hypothetical protein FS837_000697 [Tulasnella sp. UAMH 9824]
MSETSRRGTGVTGQSECQTIDPEPGVSPTLDSNYEPPIHRLPPEIIVDVVRSSVRWDTRIQDLIRLTLVCKYWSAIIHNATVLWATIDAAEGPSLVLKALKTAKGALLDLTFHYKTAQMNWSAFFMSVIGCMEHWRTLNVDLSLADWNSMLENFNKGAPPSLEALHLSSPAGQWSRGTGLFGENRAPPRLKEISLVNIPIKLAPLQLSGLKSFTIDRVAMVSAENVLNVVQGSPAIESIYFRCAVDFPPSHQASPHSGAFGSTSTHLNSLIHLSLLDLPMPSLNLVLSTIAAPHLQTLEIDCELQEASIAELLEGLRRQLATISRLAANAQTFKVCLSSYACYQIVIGGFDLTLLMDELPVNASEETFDWVCNHLGRPLKDLPAHLMAIDWEPEIPSRLEWFTHHLTITQLRLHSDPYFGTALETIIPFLCRPTTSTPVTWLLPQVEIIETNLVWGAGNDDIVEMIENRHSAEDGKDGVAAPKAFREIWLSYGGKGYRNSPSVDPEFFREVHRVANGADVYWEKEKLTDMNDNKL